MYQEAYQWHFSGFFEANWPVNSFGSAETKVQIKFRCKAIALECSVGLCQIGYYQSTSLDLSARTRLLTAASIAIRPKVITVHSPFTFADFYVLLNDLKHLLRCERRQIYWFCVAIHSVFSNILFRPEVQNQNLRNWTSKDEKNNALLR